MNSKQREELQRLSESFIVYPISHGFLSLNCKISLQEIKKIVDSVLAEPVRNFDVGTEAEQYARLESFCAKHFKLGNYNPCAKCPIFKNDSLPCVYRFLRMPYEKGGVNEQK